MKRAKLRKTLVVEGFVVCSKNGEIHETSGRGGEFDPYCYGAPERHDDEDMRCTPEDHKPVYEEIA